MKCVCVKETIYNAIGDSYQAGKVYQYQLNMEPFKSVSYEVFIREGVRPPYSFNTESFYDSFIKIENYRDQLIESLL